MEIDVVKSFKEHDFNEDWFDIYHCDEQLHLVISGVRVVLHNYEYKALHAWLGRRIKESEGKDES